MTGQPNEADVDVLIRVLEMWLSEPVRKARNFWRTIPDGLTFAELRDRYPPGTEGYEQIDTVLSFWETISGLLRKGMLNEELAFDTFLDAPPWKRIEAAARSLREERNDPEELANLEWAYHRSEEWKALRERARAGR